MRKALDLVEKQRAAMRTADDARLALPRIGERPAGMAEELVLHQVVGQRSAIDGHEWLVAPRPG